MDYEKRENLSFACFCLLLLLLGVLTLFTLNNCDSSSDIDKNEEQNIKVDINENGTSMSKYEMLELKE